MTLVDPLLTYYSRPVSVVSFWVSNSDAVIHGLAERCFSPQPFVLLCTSQTSSFCCATCQLKPFHFYQIILNTDVVPLHSPHSLAAG